jgi:hypothetical protein
MYSARRFWWLGAVLAVVVGITVAGVRIAQDEGSAASVPTVRLPATPGNLSVADAARFGEFPLHWLGKGFRGLPLTKVHRSAQPPDGAPQGINAVSFSYGQCDAVSDSGCSVPVEVQVWTACMRQLDMYEIAPRRPLPHEKATIRGVPAAFIDPSIDSRLELYTRDATIIIWAEERGVLEETAKALRSLNKLLPAVGPEDPLPAPAERGRLTNDAFHCIT